MISELDIKDSLLAAMTEAAIVPTEEININGQLQRFHVEGDNPVKRNGWVVVNIAAFPHAYFGSWRTGNKHFWQLKEPVTSAEKQVLQEMQAEQRKRYEAEKLKKYSQAAETAGLLLERAEPADPLHPYLVSKQIQPHGILQLEGVLLVPLCQGTEIVSLQAIYKDGSKRFLTGGRTRGCYFMLDEKPQVIRKLIVCEGVATGCTLREAYLDTTVVCAFTAHNLARVARDMKMLFQSADITIASDNDFETEGNPGLTKGRQAAAAISARLIYPDFSDVAGSGTDFNDYRNAGGVL